MGFFGKNKFDICPKEKFFKGLVTSYEINGTVKINARLVVPDGYTFVIGKKGKVADKFESGEHYFNFANLPQMCRRYKIDKIENGKQKDKTKADLYFVGKGVYAGKFKTYRKVSMGTKAYGFFKAHVYGVYSYKVSNIKEFMQSLLNEYDYIKTGEAENIIESWVSEVVVNELEKQNFIISDVIANNPIIANALKVKVSKLFAVAGLELIELNITKYKLPKQYQSQNTTVLEVQPNNTNTNEWAETENNLQRNLNSSEVKLPNAQTIKDDIFEKNETLQTITEKQQYYDFESLEDDIADANNLLNQFNIGGQTQRSYENQEANNQVPATKQENSNNQNIINNNVDLQNTSQKNIENLTKEEYLEQNNFELNDNKAQEQIEMQEYVPFGNMVINKTSLKELEEQQNKVEEKTFVDLSLNEVYTKKAKQTKRCLTCGAENNIDANHCLLCGEHFNNEEI